MGNREEIPLNVSGLMMKHKQIFTLLNPHKKKNPSEGINQEKKGRDPLGGTNFLLDLFTNEVTKNVG
jgi:hypothetical protein